VTNKQKIDSPRAAPQCSADIVDTTIAALEGRVDSLRTELRDAEQLLLSAKIAVTGVTIGDIVRHSRNGKRFRVTKIEPHSYSTWLMGNPERADGTFGKAERHLFDEWERIEP
jgi:hypothetical protein